MAAFADKLNIDSMKELFEIVKNTTIMSPFINKNSKFIKMAEEKGVDKINPGLSFSDDEEVDLEKNAGKADKAALTVNDLMKFVYKLKVKVKEHAKLIKFNKDMTEVVKLKLMISSISVPY